MDNVPEELIIIGVYRGSEKVYFYSQNSHFRHGHRQNVSAR